MNERMLGVQFLHPGREREPDDPMVGLRLWNTETSHYRKFIRSDGLVIDQADIGRGQTPRRAEFTFWGEWEPPSRAEPFAEADDRALPRFLHTPIFEGSGEGGQNTDPFVFGPRFRYTICRQFVRRTGKGEGTSPQQSRPTQLAKLQENSLILFGSCLAKRFVLDTVFVVGDFHDWRGERPVIDDGTDDEGIYRDATLNRIDPEDPVRLYNGVRYEDRERHYGMFSFVPCRIANGEIPRFARPSLDIDGVAHGMTQGYAFLAQDIASIFALWRSVVDHLLGKEFSLAVEIDLPRRSADRPIDTGAPSTMLTNC